MEKFLDRDVVENLKTLSQTVKEAEKAFSSSFRQHEDQIKNAFKDYIKLTKNANAKKEIHCYNYYVHSVNDKRVVFCVYDNERPCWDVYYNMPVEFLYEPDESIAAIEKELEDKLNEERVQKQKEIGAQIAFNNVKQKKLAAENEKLKEEMEKLK